VPGQRLNNFANPVNQGRYDYDAELVRLDHHFSGSNRSFLTLYRNHRDEFRSNNGLQGTFANQGQWPQTRENYGGILDWVGSIGPRAFNSVIYPSPTTDFASQNFGTIPDPKGTIYFPRNVQLGLKFFF